MVDLMWYGIEFQVETNYDFLRLYDGNSSNAVILATLTGYQIPANVTSCSNEMLVVFSSDNSNTASGYYAKIHVSEGNCNNKVEQSKKLSLNLQKSTLANVFKKKNQTKLKDIWTANMGLFLNTEMASLRLERNTQVPSQFENILFPHKSKNLTSSLISMAPMLCPKFASIGDGNCDVSNVDVLCEYDDGDCFCDFKNFTQDGHCNQANNKSFCLFDHNDCVDCHIGNCSQQTLHQVHDIADLCPEHTLIGNGICDQANNKLVCQYDGGDCTFEGVGVNCKDFECIEDQKYDPCPEYEKIGNDQCDQENFNLICSFDGDDCDSG